MFMAPTNTLLTEETKPPPRGWLNLYTKDPFTQ